MNKLTLYELNIYNGMIPEVNNKALAKICLNSYTKNKRMSKDSSDTRSEDLFIGVVEDYPELQKVVNYITDDFKKTFNKKIKMVNHWCQVHDKNESTILHDHVDYIDLKNSPQFSAVYYVKTPKDSGNLVLHYPINKYNEYFRKVITPKESYFILFPSTLDHFVTKNNSIEKRIAISFNFNYA